MQYDTHTFIHVYSAYTLLFYTCLVFNIYICLRFVVSNATFLFLT